MSKPGVFSGLSARAARLPIFYGWIVVFVAFVTMGLGVNARTSFSLLFPPISDEFGWDRGTIAAAFSVENAIDVTIPRAARRQKYHLRLA